MAAADEVAVHFAEEAEVDVSTVKRVINRNSYIYKYLPESDPRLSRK